MDLLNSPWATCSMKLDRRTLYEQVWTTPMSRLCKTYGVSDVWLARTCDEHRIPYPPRGYWAKKRNGKPVRRKPLPSVVDSRLETVSLYPRPVENRVSEPTEADRRVAAERANGASIVVQEGLVDPHDLVVRTMTSLKATKADEKGMIRPKAKGCLDVTVGSESIDRAMRILDALIKALESRSYRVFVKDGEGSTTLVEVDGEIIPFRMDERASRKERPVDDRKTGRHLWFLRPRVEYDYFPSGELALHISHSVPQMFRHSWRDGGKKRVEDWLNSFVVGLIRVSQGIKVERVEAERRRIEAEKRRKEWEESERQRQELERRRKELAERIRQLEVTLDGWIRYRNLAEMVAEVRSRASQLGREVPSESRLGMWLALAEERVQALDPIGPMLAELDASGDRVTPAEGDSIG